MVVQSLPTKKLLLRKIIEKDERFKYIDGDASNNSIIFNVIFNGVERLLKIRPNDTKKQSAEKIYHNRMTVEDKSYLTKVVGEKPLILGNYNAVVLEKGEYSLEDYLNSKEFSKKNPELEFKKIMIQVTKGVYELHKCTIKHRDVKPSNIIFYKNTIVWTIGDDDESTYDDVTKSYQGTEQYTSYEYLKKVSDGGYRDWLISDDIFSIGAVAYQILNPTHTPLRTEYTHRKNLENGVSYYDFSMKIINDLKVSEFHKYLLKRLLGKEAPSDEDLSPGDSLKNYRYRSLSQFIKELISNKIDVDESFDSANEDYLKFIEFADNLTEIIKKSNKNRNSKEWNLVSNNSIWRVASGYRKIKTLANSENVELGAKTDEIFSDVTEKYEQFYLKDKKIINDLISKMESGNMILTDNQVLKLYEKIFLYGHYPFTTEEDRSNGKGFYTLEETKKGQTHYHEYFNIEI